MRFFLAPACLLLWAAPSPAQQPYQTVPAQEVSEAEALGLPTTVVAPGATPTDNADDALGEVNALRATRGKKPFLRDEALTVAARACARHRATNLIFGHIPGRMGDFAFLPPGARADAAGCAAYPVHYGWMSCAQWEDYRYAGAAWAWGRDGKRYCHLFVSNTPNGPRPAAKDAREKCPCCSPTTGCGCAPGRQCGHPQCPATVARTPAPPVYAAPARPAHLMTPGCVGGR